MPVYRITLAAERYESNTMVVEAADVETACRIALEQDDGDYEPGDLGESWVEKIATYANGARIYPEVPLKYRDQQAIEAAKWTAIIARVNGEWDHPALAAYGPLGSITDDILRIAGSDGSQVYDSFEKAVTLLVDILKPGSTNASVLEDGRDFLAGLGIDVRSPQVSDGEG